MSVKYREGLVGIQDREACGCQNQRDLWLDRRIDYLFILQISFNYNELFSKKPW